MAIGGGDAMAVREGIHNGTPHKSFSALFCVVALIFVWGSASRGLAQALAEIENSILFFPDKTLVATPEKIKLAFDKISLLTADKVKLHAWWVPRQNARATLIFSHGNAGNISHRLAKLRIFHDLGLNVLLYDYRGYGRSEGSPNEKGLYADVQAAYDFAVKEKNIPADRIIAYGESLGGPVAAHLAANNTVNLLILDSTFTNLKDMAQSQSPLLVPLVQSKFDTLSDVANVKSPTLILHSPDDEVVPYAQGRQLFAASKARKKFVKLHGSHNGGFLASKKAYVKGLGEFLTANVAKARLPVKNSR
jgi:uncharacterized protein